MDIAEKVKRFPDSPGIYLMKDAQGEILYIGKASSLKKRVSSYYQKPPVDKILALLSRVSDITYIQTVSSAQALILENALIKEHQPYYNAALKDDKSYPFIMIDTRLEYPTVTIGRGKKEKGILYYGPYTSARELKNALKTLRALFPFRSCATLPRKPCLYLQLALCPGMCVGAIAPEQYREHLRQFGLFLNGKFAQLLAQLKAKMHSSAQTELFEEAAGLRDRIASLEEVIAQTNESRQQNSLVALESLLGLNRTPYRIEAFDVSEIAGAGLCGSMVSFTGGRPDKDHYRRFKIKTVTGVDDYAMLRELIRRRYGQKDQAKALVFVDLVMVDGGKGQWSSARQELDELGLESIPVISLAKRLETLFTPTGAQLQLPGNSPALQLLQRIRDEAHRFAITYHRVLRDRQLRSSVLDGIAGVGPQKKRALLRHFKSVPAIKEAGVENLLKVRGIDRKTAQNIVKYLANA